VAEAIQAEAPDVTPEPPATEVTPETAIASEVPFADPALAGKEPRPRPASLEDPAENGSLDAATDAAVAAATADPEPPGEIVNATDLAVASSPVPPSRPSGLSARAATASSETSLRAAQEAASAAVASALAEAEADGEVATVTTGAEVASNEPSVGPTIPTRASVAAQATEENAIRLNRINLIGVFGGSSDRRALIRLPSGRFVKVQVGDRVDGGQVAAIGDSELRYTKGGRSYVLRVAEGG
jgi:type IV pilus biogenesis protein PilP